MKWFAAMLLAVSVVACGDDNDDNSVFAPQQQQQVSLVGTWKLQTINGFPLPYLLDQIGEDKLELMEASIVARSQGTFTSSSIEQTTIAGQVETHAFSEDGTYVINGRDVQLTFDIDGASVVGTVRGDSLIFTGGGVPVIYRRQ